MTLSRRKNLKAAQDAIWHFLEMQADNPESWYPDPPRNGIGIHMYHYQAMWDNRQCPRVYRPSLRSGVPSGYG